MDGCLKLIVDNEAIDTHHIHHIENPPAENTGGFLHGFFIFVQ